MKSIYIDVCALSRPFDDQSFSRIRLETEALNLKKYTVKYMDEEILLKKAIRLLIKELGPVEAIRFISMPQKKRMESVKRHREWQRHLDKDKFFAEIFESE